jgi:hypothetical protein
MYDNFKRRANDFEEMENSRHQADIDKLIEEEDDPRKRLHLIVMNRINLSLVAHTQTIKAVSRKLEEHLEAFEKRSKDQDAMVNKGKGAWRIIAVVLGFLQVGSVWLGTMIIDDMKKTHEDIKVIATEQARRDIRIRYIEEYVAKHQK